MVEFGKTLKNAQREGWESNYINYNALKKILKKSHQKALNRSSSFACLVEGNINSLNQLPQSQLVVLEFRHALDNEIEKVVLFLLQEQGNIAKELNRLGQERNCLVDRVSLLLHDYQVNDGVLLIGCKSTWQCLKESHHGYVAVAHSILEFVAFVELNVTAVRKILKKHDKNHPEHHLSHVYLSSFTSVVDSHLDQLYNYGGLSALAASMTRAFGELHHLELNLLMMSEEKPSHRRARSVPAIHLSNESLEEEGVTMVSTHKESFPINMMGPPATVFALENKPSTFLPTQITSAREPLLDKIRVARNRLKQSTKYVDVVAAQALMFEGDEAESLIGEEDRLAEMTRSQRISSFLNLCSTFLYMTNYYIVAPTCGQYALLLGSTEAMAGIIIGMTPNAALIATVLYGWWSNFSYKSALIFAASSSLVGNVLYALALKHNSLTLVMMGRFFNGFGSARAINRRFIADTFSRSERTAASAAFVTAGALGMATGPAIAALLGRINFPDDGLLWSVETSPGWVMLGMWSIFWVCTALFFEEPDRTHIFGPKPSSTVELTATPVTSNNSVHSEREPLLKNRSSSPSSKQLLGEVKDPPIYTNAPVMMTLWIYFVLKLVLESLMSSCATLTTFYFGWNSQFSGSFLAFLGLLMFPANMVVARLSHRYEDRELIYVTLIIMFFSILGIIAYSPSHYTVVQYVIFGICVFLSTNILEGPNMSLLSKTIPRSWAKGTFNSGFLATEAGTAARSVADILISASAGLLGFSSLLNAVFLPMLLLVSITLWYTRRYYDQMSEVDDDDDASNSRKSFSSRQSSFEDD